MLGSNARSQKVTFNEKIMRIAYVLNNELTLLDFVGFYGAVAASLPLGIYLAEQLAGPEAAVAIQASMNYR